MKNKRLQYFIIVLLVITLGILSRKIVILPLCIGDILYAVMIYFIIRMLFLNRSFNQVAFISLALCFLIEFSQLYQARWMVEIRNTTLGHYTLGQGFLWSDLAAYFFGIIIAFLFDKNLKK